MPTLNLKALDPADLMPIPDVPERYGPRNAEDERVYALVKSGIESGAPLPVDDTFFARLRARIATHKSA